MQITKKLGSATPVITSVARGIIGSDAITEEFKEVSFCMLNLFVWLEFLLEVWEWEIILIWNSLGEVGSWRWRF